MSDRSAWDRFWFGGTSPVGSARLRGLLCVIAIAYYAACLWDLAFWFAEGGVITVDRVSAFVAAGGLQRDAVWNLSPLFLTNSIWIYRLYLVVSMLVLLAVIMGKGGRIACWLGWLLFVGWVHREMLVVGIGENLLSLGLFAAAIAPAGSAWDATGIKHWTKSLSERLMAMQITVVAVATFVTMLGGRVWFNGLGAYAIAAPWMDRSIDWTARPSFADPLVHEPLTHLMLIGLPLGFALAWNRRTARWGVGILLVWCLLVGVLGSHWLYASTFATMTMAIPGKTSGKDESV